ncbi:MAG: putative DNA-binding ribbon-helix-helix protein [Litorivivens sp.]|jgi:predicted DNA-binding ribbon-helix-helix protein
MCEYFVKADPIQYEQRSRSVRIRNVMTSLRLENMVWDILAEMAEEEGCTTNALISKFHNEIMAYRGEVPNFASFLRVTSMRYLRRCVTSLERQQELQLSSAHVMSITSRPEALDNVPKTLLAVGR